MLSGEGKLISNGDTKIGSGRYLPSLIPTAIAFLPTSPLCVRRECLQILALEGSSNDKADRVKASRYFAIRQAIAAEMKSAMEYLAENTNGLFIVVPKGGNRTPMRLPSPDFDILHNCFILLNKIAYKKYAYVKIQPLTVLCIISKVTFYFCFH
jgi:hypothetical protein